LWGFECGIWTFWVETAARLGGTAAGRETGEVRRYGGEGRHWNLVVEVGLVDPRLRHQCLLLHGCVRAHV